MLGLSYAFRSLFFHSNEIKSFDYAAHFSYDFVFFQFSSFAVIRTLLENWMENGDEEWSHEIILIYTFKHMIDVRVRSLTLNEIFRETVWQQETFGSKSASDVYDIRRRV